jgi:hypothetical protein
VKPLVRVAALASACLAASASAARADFILTPFVGKTFAAQSTVFTSASVDKQRWVIGASGTWLSDNILGAEVDFGYVPRFFEDPAGLVKSGSNAISLIGNVLVAVPVSVSRESLRPYVSLGMGMVHAGAEDSLAFSTVDRNLLAVSVGGGAIGFLNRRVGVRFDLRRIRSTSTTLSNSTLLSEPRLGFWRATIGVAIRY